MSRCCLGCWQILESENKTRSSWLKWEVKSSTSKATPSATHSFKRSYRVYHSEMDETKWPWGIERSIVLFNYGAQWLQEIWTFFLSEAVEASWCYFFENWLIKTKCHNLLNRPPKRWNWKSQSVHLSEPIYFVHFNVRHPVFQLKYGLLLNHKTIDE